MSLTKVTNSMISGAAINVLDYGAVADATWNGTAASGTDNLAAFNLAATAAKALSKHLYIPGGFYYLSAKWTVPAGLKVYGDGRVWAESVGSGHVGVSGTCLLCNGNTSSDCVQMTENSTLGSIESISIFNATTNAIRSVVSCIGQLYPYFRDVEIDSLLNTSGAGLLLYPSETGALYETLWGDFHSVKTGGGIHTGLIIQSNAAGVCNTNCFYGGDIAGRVRSHVITGSTGLNLAVSFFGTRFEGNYSASDTITFVSGGANVYGYINTSCYVQPFVDIVWSRGAEYAGCYFEGAGYPGSYNDGVNGAWPVLGVVRVSANAASTRFDGGSLVGGYLYDLGVGTKASSFSTDGLALNNTKPTAASRKINGVQTFLNNTVTKKIWGTSVSDSFEWLLWDAANNNFICKSPGVYDVSAQVALNGVTAIGYAQCSVWINSTQTFNGNYTSAMTLLALPATTSVQCLVTLAVDDTVSIYVESNSVGASITNGADSKDSFFCITKVTG